MIFFKDFTGIFEIVVLIFPDPPAKLEKTIEIYGRIHAEHGRGFQLFCPAVPLEYRHFDIAAGNGAVVKDNQFIVFVSAMDQKFIGNPVFDDPKYIHLFPLYLIHIQLIIMNGNFRIGKFFYFCILLFCGHSGFNQSNGFSVSVFQSYSSPMEKLSR